MSGAETKQLLVLHSIDGNWALTESVTIDKATVLIPGELVLNFAVTMPVLKGRALQQAIPFACEDKLAQGVEYYHFAHSKHDGNQVVVFAMLESDYSTLREFIASNAIKASACYPDYLALPHIPGKTTVLAHNGRVLVRETEYLGMSFAQEHMSAVLPALVSEREDVQFVVSGDHDFMQEFETIAVSNLSTVVERIDAIQIDADNLPDDINLLSSKDVAKEKASPVGRVWIFNVILLIAMIMVFLGVRLELLHRYNSANTKLTQKMTQLYNTVIPGKDLPYDVRSALQPLLSKASGDSKDVFVASMQKVGAVLISHSAISVQSISYGNKQLSLVLTAANQNTFNSFLQACAKAGLHVVKEQMIPSGKTTTLNVTLEDK